MDRATRGRLLARVARSLGDGARKAGAGGVAGGRYLTDVFANEIAPRLTIRDLETLRSHNHGLIGEPLADALVTRASRATATVGAAGGALAAVQFAAPPLLLTAPAQLVAETLVVAAVEVKLIAELHAVYGVTPQGGGLARTSGFLMAWAHRRGVDPLAPGSLTVALGTAARTALRRRLMRTLGRHLTTMGPMLTGAVAGGTLNRAATRRLAAAVRTDLRAKGIEP
ncbi:MAG: hypothetical protein GEV11_26590 [Streptosporangiales bacterium]|nr:hypothetical protein [Streptosporangiales bacterium]